MDRLRDTGSEATRYRLAKAMEECMRAQPVDAITVIEHRGALRRHAADLLPQLS